MKKLKSRLKMNWFYAVVALFFFGNVYAQKDKELLKIEQETKSLLSDATSELADDDFVDAEVNYRKAIAISPTEEIGKYNLGNAYYNEEKNKEAMQRFAQAAEVSESKSEKHRAFHNLGNTLMNEKNYQAAVEAYKNALRNDPTDDETRYNFALAKDMLEKNPPQGGEGENENEDQNEDQNENKEDQQDEKESDDGKEKEGDDGEQKEDEGEGDEKKEQNQGDNEEKEGKPDEPKDEKDGKGDQEKQQPNQPVPGQLSPQQIKNLLEAMNNEEKKVQDKINAKKLKGPKVKSNKDW